MLSTILEAAGLIGIAVAVALLAGVPWGLLAASLGAILYGWALDKSGEGDK